MASLFDSEHWEYGIKGGTRFQEGRPTELKQISKNAQKHQDGTTIPFSQWLKVEDRLLAQGKRLNQKLETKRKERDKTLVEKRKVPIREHSLEVWQRLYSSSKQSKKMGCLLMENSKITLEDIVQPFPAYQRSQKKQNTEHMKFNNSYKENLAMESITNSNKKQINILKAQNLKNQIYSPQCDRITFNSPLQQSMIQYLKKNQE